MMQESTSEYNKMLSFNLRRSSLRTLKELHLLFQAPVFKYTERQRHYIVPSAIIDT